MSKALAHIGALALLSLALGCGDGGTGPSIPSVGPIGPIPQGLTGKVAFVISGVVATSSGSHIESKVHVIDMANPTDQVIYTAAPDVSIQGLTWAPDAQHLVIQTVLFRVDSDGHNLSVWELHSRNTAGSDDNILFSSSAPKYHPTYSPGGRLAYFSGWSDDPAAGIFVDGRPVYALPYASSSYLSWRPDVNAIIYSGPGDGLHELRLDSGGVTQLLAAEAGEVIQEPAVSPDGSRIALMRFGGNRNAQEIWTVDFSRLGCSAAYGGIRRRLPGLDSKRDLSGFLARWGYHRGYLRHTSKWRDAGAGGGCFLDGHRSHELVPLGGEI